MSTIKPRAPLPWERELDDVKSPQSAPLRCRVIRSVGGPVVAYDIGIPEADYIVHAANAYPKLVDLLKTISTGGYVIARERSGKQTILPVGQIKALLAELGELPSE
jgi:hypothetical protein